MRNFNIQKLKGVVWASAPPPVPQDDRFICETYSGPTACSYIAKDDYFKGKGMQNTTVISLLTIYGRTTF